MKKILNIIIVTSLSISIISCAKTNEDLYLVNGPPIRNIETHFSDKDIFQLIKLLFDVSD